MSDRRALHPRVGLALRRRSHPEPADHGAPDRPPATPSSASGVVDSAVYCAGQRECSPGTLGDTYEALRERRDGMAWIGLYRPGEDELGSLAHEFGLHELAVEDAVTAHQRPKLERYGDTLFVVLRAARYLDDVEEVEFGELHVFLGRDFVITVRHAESPDLAVVRHRLEDDPELLAKGTEAVLYAILDAVVDGYVPVVKGIENDVDEIETQVFDGDPAVSRRIYELSREVVDFQRAAHPLTAMLESLAGGFDKYDVDEELRRALRDVADHVTQVNERIDSLRVLLRDILQVNSILVAQKQNEEMTALSRTSNAQNDEVKKISAWAAIGFAPTTIASIYGMNFKHLPETQWLLGYPFALGLMVLAAVVLYVLFKRRGWI
ncbi:magnesium transporter [Jatrophihabitans endophyticus]|uniref:Magnesium transporter n=1 Tax=Jatrophihabitans endophyticus TaxID=1206085 RepID=A0A1M5DCN0_9ACTN|nr:magnesium and cobalt transport protein CorA [Jatrophihabitans endophyticus]SHF64621.1 magnesium transporter [Jatrophihabitans endophyticus]